MSDFWDLVSITLGNSADPQQYDKLSYMLSRYIEKIDMIRSKIPSDDSMIPQLDQVLIQEMIEDDKYLRKLETFTTQKLP